MTGPAGSAEYLRNLLVGHIPVQLACAMAGLGLADLLADGPMTVDELSAAAKARPDLLRRLVRGLADIGLVTLEDDDRVSATEMGALLRSGTVGSMRELALYRGGPSYTSWGKLEHTVRTGEPAFEAALGAPFFSYMRDHPEDGAAFDGGMTRLSLDIIDEALARYDFSVARRILDVGGGRGHFAAAVLEAHPQLEGAVLDLPERIGAADAYLAAAAWASGVQRSGATSSTRSPWATTCTSSSGSSTTGTTRRAGSCSPSVARRCPPTAGCSWSSCCCPMERPPTAGCVPRSRPTCSCS